MYTTQMLVGSDNQGGSNSVILLDLTSSGIYLELKSKSINGVYDWKKSKSYTSIGDRKNPIYRHANGRDLRGWDANDKFGLVS